MLNKIPLIWGIKDLVTKRHSSAKYNSNRTKGNAHFYVARGFQVSLQFSTWAFSCNCNLTFFSVALKLILQLVKQTLRFFFCLIFDRDVLIGSLRGLSQWQSFSLLRFQVSLSGYQVSVTGKVSLRVKQFCALSSGFSMANQNDYEKENLKAAPVTMAERRRDPAQSPKSQNVPRSS